MKRNATWLLAFVVLLTLIIGACAPAAPPATAEPPAPVVDPTTPAEEEPAPPVVVPDPVTMTIGFTASITGKYEVASAAQVNGFNLWMEQINAAGGVVLSDGTVVTFDSVSYDDESNTERVQELYTRLATEDQADFMISPYSSGLTSAAALIAEQYGTLMITTGAASDATYKQGYEHIFQAYTPASRYLTGAVDLLKHTDPSVTKLAFVHENDKFSTDVVAAAVAYAESLGYEVVLYEGYASETADFAPFINKIEASAPDAILGGGHMVDGTAFARQLFEKGTPVKFFALLVAPPEPAFADLGDAAVGVIGPSQWEPLAGFSAETAGDATWFGPSSADFNSAYVSAYGAEPSYHGAGGYVAGLMLEMAIRNADSVEPAELKVALEALDVLTFYGAIKFDTSAESHGLQIGHSMIYAQWQKDADGNLVKQVVWPVAGATAPTIYPLR